jgi:hypothetical protein
MDKSPTNLDGSTCATVAARDRRCCFDGDDGDGDDGYFVLVSLPFHLERLGCRIRITFEPRLRISDLEMKTDTQRTVFRPGPTTTFSNSTSNRCSLLDALDTGRSR